jgi:hypothetical protein
MIRKSGGGFARVREFAVVEPLIGCRPELTGASFIECPLDHAAIAPSSHRIRVGVLGARNRSLRADRLQQGDLAATNAISVCEVQTDLDRKMGKRTGLPSQRKRHWRRPDAGVSPDRDPCPAGLCHCGASVVTAVIAVINRPGGSREIDRHPTFASVRGFATRRPRS